MIRRNNEMGNNQVENPMISIIVPIYNVEKYLRACIDSILTQTYKNLEIILVDDGSSDECGNICDEYKEKDHRIIVIHQKNKGLSGARNAGIDIAQGQYIGFIDSDDTIEPEMFEILMKNMKKNGARISICGRKIVDEVGNIIEPKYIRKKEMVLDGKSAIIEMNSHMSFDMSACDKLYDISIWEDIRYPEGKLSEDFFVIFRLLDKAQKIVWTPQTLYRYFQRNNSISRSSVIKQDFIEASEAQMNYIHEKYPDIDYVGKAAYASACLTIYDLYLKRKMTCPSDLTKLYQRNVKSCLPYVRKNPTLDIKKKIQAYLFVVSPKLYSVTFKIFKKVYGVK